MNLITPKRMKSFDIQINGEMYPCGMTMGAFLDFKQQTGYDLSKADISDSPAKRIYEAVKRIPYGQVATYAQVAHMAGDRKMARAVGNALHKNPDPDNIPCYRVVNAKGEIAGEFAFGGALKQAELLMAEGVEVVDGKVDLEKYQVK